MKGYQDLATMVVRQFKGLLDRPKVTNTEGKEEFSMGRPGCLNPNYSGILKKSGILEIARLVRSFNGQANISNTTVRYNYNYN